MKRSVFAAMAVAAMLAACGSQGGDGSSPSGSPATGDDAELQQKKLTLRVPVIFENGSHALVSTKNAALKAAGIQGSFPDYVELEGSKTGFATKASHKKWDDATALFAKAQEANVPGFDNEMLQFGEPASYDIGGGKGICYTGNPKLIPNLIGSLTDSVFSDQFGWHGWRWKKVKQLDENITPEDEKSFPKIWQEWRGDGDAILMLTHTSDDGSEMNVNIIPKCK